MSRKVVDSGKANLALRLLMYFRIGLYNTLLSMSQSTIMDKYGRMSDPQTQSGWHDANDKDDQ